MKESFHFSQNEAQHFIDICNEDTSKDNMMFLKNIKGKDEVFLMLHGTTTGYVIYNNEFLTLKELYQCLKKENTFNLITNLWGCKCIHIICCHSYFVDSYEEDGIILKTVFNNKGYIEATLDSRTNMCSFEEVA